MVSVITEFFNTIMGVTVPDSVSLIIAFALCFTVLRLLFGLLRLDNKIVSYAAYTCITLIALLALGGMTWSFTFTQ